MIGRDAVAQYIKDVEEQSFPSDAESFAMKPDVLKELSASMPS